MKCGLISIPGEVELQRAYDLVLHYKPSRPSSIDLALFSQWSRFDPRLAEIWVTYLARCWKRLNPIALRNALLQQPWPSAAGVLLEFVGNQVVPMESRDESVVFRLWSQLVTVGFSQGRYEQFFIGLRHFGGIPMGEDARFSLKEYRKWGYLGREVLINKGKEIRAGKSSQGQHMGSLDPDTREQILKSLLDRFEKITTEMYWKAIGQCISRRQAERDLRRSPLLRAMGHTKGRSYFTLASKRSLE